MKPRPVLVLISALVAGAVLLLACGGGGGGREVAITAMDDSCTPTSLSARAGEKLTFVVKNEAKGDREIEGIEGTRLEEVLVPSGRTRKLNYTVPSSGSTQKLKCYIPGGPQTIIEIQVESASSDGGSSGAAKVNDEAYDRTIDVELNEWMVKPETMETQGGRIRFVARNVSTTLVHELAVVSVSAKGDKKEIADVEGLKPGETGELVVALKAGSYQLACLIAKGQENSPEDHYQKGMYTAFTVR